jgi:hypothetical protein
VGGLKVITNLEERPAIIIIIIPPAIKKEAAVFVESSVNNIKSASKLHFQIKVSIFML